MAVSFRKIRTFANVFRNSQPCRYHSGMALFMPDCLYPPTKAFLHSILWVSVSYITLLSRRNQDIKPPDIRPISSLISGDIRCEVRNEGSHNGRFPSKKAAVNLTTALVRILFYFSLKLSPNPFTIGSRKYLMTDCFPILTSTTPDKPDITLIPGFVLSTSSFTR